ncbi:hypothetical protein N7519_011702 [Penicillium mononematosum]|uniref:uncharacterized protein n=1 Tax=Penicillium mononematosum TaxID=268346 RepID=UPI00254679B8|nr:uncharacterized protein N7519_011702 [Penicillium mononematosum]KAJ6181241.1 hypothetical protein N7519_011702 [Penicillium mononematosum]
MIKLDFWLIGPLCHVEYRLIEIALLFLSQFNVSENVTPLISFFIPWGIAMSWTPMELQVDVLLGQKLKL